MKTISLICIFLLAGFGLKAQTNTGILQIILDVSQLSGSCNLLGADTVYMHSGLGWTNEDSVWETIVGHWGKDDGVGEMTQIGLDSFSICFNIADYYTYEADPDSNQVGGVGYGPMAPGATPYNIGLVFRVPTCPTGANGKPACTEQQTGKDENCENILIASLNDPPNMGVFDNGGNAFSAVSAFYVSQCFDSSTAAGIGNTGSIVNVRTHPVPFNDMVWIDFSIMDREPSSAAVYNMVGQKVADLSNQLRSGSNNLIWKGVDGNGAPVAGGVYTFRINNNNQTYTGKIIKQ